jgi:hypothetical protein
MKQFKWFTGIFLPALFMAVLLQACENDLNQVKKISALEASKPVDSTLGVDVIYSDSAKVRAHMITPLMLRQNPTDPNKGFYEMPKGVKIVFYDDKLNQKAPNFDADKHIVSTVTSDYAITSNMDKLIELRKNVVVKNTEGAVFTTQQLFYDTNKKLIYSNVACQMTKPDGTALDGTSFTSNETFTNYAFKQGKGTIATSGKLGQ